MTDVPCEFNLTIIDKNGKFGFCSFDDAKNVVIEPKFDYADLFHFGLAKVELDGKWGFIDHFSNIAIPIIYDNHSIFRQGNAGVTLNGKSFRIDYKGNQIE